MKKTLFLTLAASFSMTVLQAQDVPLVYSVENTAAANADPVFPGISELPYCEPLTDPFEFSDKSGRALDFADWSRRRGEIAREIQHYEIGDKPVVSLDDIEASMNGNVLTVKTTINGQVLTQTATISYPSGGTAPYPLMIGADNNSLPSSMFSSRNIATMNFTANQVNGYSQFGGSSARDFERLYPELAGNGAYSEWAWGFSRLLDGLQKLGPEVTKIDMAHIGVTGCSYAGKMALFCGAFDERVALTIAQESGGGGCAAWRVTRVHNRDYTKEDAWEGLDNTDYSWFMKSLKETYGQDKTFYLPYDHHELAALCCPRALLMLGNPDYKWLADGSGYVSMVAARKVWQQYGIGDRCGYSIVGGHSHCQLPQNQYAEVEAFLDKFMLGIETANTDNVARAPYYTDDAGATPLEELGQWMDWWGTGEPNVLPNDKPVPVMVWGLPEDMLAPGCTDFVVEEDAAVPGGKYVRALNVNKTCPEDKQQALAFNFTIAQQQNCYVYAYVNCAKSTNDAVFLGFDDNPALASNGASSKGEWAWKSLYALLSSADKTAFVKNLAAGEHTAYIYDKEADYKIALLCVSNTESLNDFKNDIADIDINNVMGLSTIAAKSGLLRGVTADNGYMHVMVGGENGFVGSLEVYDMTGTCVAKQSLRLPAGSQHVVTLPVASAHGVYLVSMKADNNARTETRKVVLR